MKLRTIGYLLPIVLLLLSACDSGASFRMINRTAYPVYAYVDNKPMTIIPGGEERVFEVDTDTQSFLTGKVKRKVPVRVYGETYSLIDDINRPQQDTTEVTLQAGKTLNAFLHANRASVKVINELDTAIARAEIWMNKVNYLSETRIATFMDIEAGTEQWLRVRPCGQSDPFYYTVKVYIQGDEYNPLEYGNLTSIIYVDEQFVARVSPPEE
jgi:hypothetical protein